MNLEPEIITYDDESIKIIFSEDFQKLYDAEIDWIDQIKNYYWEDPHHCKMFNFKNVYKFDEDIEKIIEQFLFEKIDIFILNAIKYKVMSLCNDFISGKYIARSIDYYTVWNQEKFK